MCSSSAEGGRKYIIIDRRCERRWGISPLDNWIFFFLDALTCWRQIGLSSFLR